VKDVSNADILGFMKSRAELQKEEDGYIAKLKQDNPKLFQSPTYIDNNAFLQTIGMELPGKDQFPVGLIKAWPQDFIVEEIADTSTIYTIGSSDTPFESAETDPNQKTVYATLVKCMVSTLGAVDELAKLLTTDPKNITYAGIKDRDALTSQQIAFRNVSIEAVKNITSKHFFLKDIQPGKGVMQKGGLQGNRFTILIRTESDFGTSDKFRIFTENLRKVKNEGFYNFYYLQRFGQEAGTSRTNSLSWAVNLLKGDYRQAVVEFLSSSTERELPFYRNLRTVVGSHSGNWELVHQILSPFPITFSGELKVVDHLVKHPDDYIGALNQIPDSIMLWIYSISSYLFNKKLSQAALKGGLLPRELPLFLSNEQDDWMFYKKELEELGIYPPHFKNIAPFRNIELRHRTVPTKGSVEFHSVDVLEEGVILTFSLNKGSYATTLISHLCNLSFGTPPSSINTAQADFSSALNEQQQKTLEYFQSIIKSNF
jgi:TruD family tRNA pseudouridine synthase